MNPSSNNIFRWSLIAGHLPGRTDNEIKNYWNSHLSRKIFSYNYTTSTKHDATTMIEPQIIAFPPKRRGGRTSRWAMKKNKTYALKTKLNNHQQSPKQVQIHQNNDAVPLPPTPSLESENLTMIMDFMALDPEREEEEEEVGDGLGKSSSQQEENTRGTLVQEDQYFAVEEGERINEMFCIEGWKEKSDYEILGQYQEVINGCWELNFNEFMDTCFVEQESGVLSLTFEEVVGNGATRNEPTCTTNQCSNGECRDLCSSMALSLDHGNNNNSDLDFESVIQFNGNMVSKSLEDKENLLSWLWEDDDGWGKDCDQFGDIDSQLDVMVAWFS
ncbi:PREDICTED: uncharacterized protein LOC109344633 [Lupinus angustifolius]|uniref:uncharacterized protein LOC109344633 n=1 Tax=Lupinus angustifolius TaxID=3871 RepID=UPI00092E7B80|nr:PREDICTED: uncharacterized protein LOC109344633 [Lupinus angustifolius]